MECWSGWGYRVAPETLAFQGPRLLLVTEGPVDWATAQRVRLHPLDPKTGRVDPAAPALVIRPRQPRLHTRHAGPAVDDIADIVGEPDRLMLGLRKVGPNVLGSARQEAFLRWACGRAP